MQETHHLILKKLFILKGNLKNQKKNLKSFNPIILTKKLKILNFSNKMIS